MAEDIQDRISSVQNIHKITRAMEMVAAARLRRAEERIEVLRPYADGIRRMARRAVEAAETIPDLPILEEHDAIDTVGLLLVSSDRGLAGPFNSQVMRAASGRAREIQREEGAEMAWYASGKKVVSSLGFAGYDLAGTYSGHTDKPSYADARNIAEDLIAAYTDGELDRVEMVYNGYISPMQQNVRREILLPLQQAEFFGEEEEEEAEDDEDEEEGGRDDPDAMDQGRSLWIYEPDPGEILRRLAPDFVEISIYRALLESTAAEHGARMTAMRSASDNAEEMIEDLSLEANRQRQAEITQELMEVVAGAEALG
ncbi:MAG: ATP synthase F1 subunit gamma [Actinomycetota bacterium]|nr:ATP synthase F1 subunit gamma [Actinomycetota bacterium]